MKKSKPRNKYSFGAGEGDIMRQLTAGDCLMSFLLSARSTRLMYREARKRAYVRYCDKRSIENLERKGFLVQRGDWVVLTQKGKEIMDTLAARGVPTEKAWDGLWRVVMYDIPVSMSPFRFALRRILVQGGFRKLQHSVWVHPGKSKELELLLKKMPRLRGYVRCVEVAPFTDLETIADWRKLGTT